MPNIRDPSKRIEPGDHVKPPPLNRRDDGTPTTNPWRERMVRPPFGRFPAALAVALVATLLVHSACGQELVLLDFWSASCGPCMQMKPTVKSLASANYPIREVDVTREPQLARDFRVDRIPCFVMLVNGQEVDRVVGATSSERLVQMFDRARVRLQSPDNRPPAPTAQSVPWTGGGDSSARLGAGDSTNSVPVAPLNSVPVEPALAAATTSSAGPTTLDSLSPLLAATVRLQVEDANGRSFGTGTIIDARSGEALVITCGHLFRQSQGKGPVTVELFELGPQGLRVVGKVTAK
jgi:thiol-disulfide isomerase/thioredoxin